jgi:hypothetical protein
MKILYKKQISFSYTFHRKIEPGKNNHSTNIKIDFFSNFKLFNQEQRQKEKKKIASIDRQSIHHYESSRY